MGIPVCDTVLIAFVGTFQDTVGKVLELWQRAEAIASATTIILKRAHYQKAVTAVKSIPALEVRSSREIARRRAG